MSRTLYFILFGLFGCFVWATLSMISRDPNSEWGQAANGPLKHSEVAAADPGLLSQRPASQTPSALVQHAASKRIATDSFSPDLLAGRQGDPGATADNEQVMTAAQQDGQVNPEPAPAAAANVENLTVSPMPPETPEALIEKPQVSPTPLESPVANEPEPESDDQVVHTDYRKAMQEAVEDRKMLFIYFYEPKQNAARSSFERLTLADEEIQEKLKRYVFVKLPRDASVTVDGKSISLLGHAAFAEMLGRQGVSIVDLVHVRSEYYGHVVSTFPFTPGKYYRKEALSIILDLPSGTLTQRTMIYAVRIHPEAPASTQGQFHAVLAEEAKMSADHQASILVQGHHSWDARFQRINAKLPSGLLAQEVVAESWPNEGLVEACVDCVHSWRQSPGHWGAVRSRHPLFGYDIKRGRNGIWYATGIFGQR